MKLNFLNPIARRGTAVLYRCICGREFEGYPSQMKKRVSCGSECFVTEQQIHDRLGEIPTMSRRLEIEGDMVGPESSVVKIARTYGEFLTAVFAAHARLTGLSIEDVEMFSDQFAEGSELRVAALEGAKSLPDDQLITDPRLEPFRIKLRERFKL